jgi:hypothetical protein
MTPRTLLAIALILIGTTGVGVAQGTQVGFQIPNQSYSPLYSMVGSALEQAVRLSGLQFASEWSVEVAPAPYAEIGTHSASHRINSSGGTVRLADSSSSNRIRMQVIEFSEILDSVPVAEATDPELRSRTSSVAISFLITDAEGIVKLSDVIRESFRDTILVDGREQESGPPPHDRDKSFWERLLIPFAIIGATGIAVFLLFHVRS